MNAAHVALGARVRRIYSTHTPHRILYIGFGSFAGSLTHGVLCRALAHDDGGRSGLGGLGGGSGGACVRAFNIHIVRRARRLAFRTPLFEQIYAQDVSSTSDNTHTHTVQTYTCGICYPH